MWHEVFMASPQKFWGICLFSSITLAISWITRFFLFTTPFCWRVLGAENSILIPFFAQNDSNLAFLNSFPWSLLILTIGAPFSFYSFLQRISNFSHASNFSLRNSTQVYLEKSSTRTIMYLFPPRLSILVDPIRSTWRSSKHREVAITFTLWWLAFVCFPIWHAP